MALRFEILPGLPPYGPLPVQFSATGCGTHREGFVVQFDGSSVPWVGNDQRGKAEMVDEAMQWVKSHEPSIK
jgi:hypothetical protein